jgi:hypothetical protein
LETKDNVQGWNAPIRWGSRKIISIFSQWILYEFITDQNELHQMEEATGEDMAEVEQEEEGDVDRVT